MKKIINEIKMLLQKILCNVKERSQGKIEKQKRHEIHRNKSKMAELNPTITNTTLLINYTPI